jgi:hypothetical protein
VSAESYRVGKSPRLLEWKGSSTWTCGVRVDAWAPSVRMCRLYADARALRADASIHPCGRRMRLHECGHADTTRPCGRKALSAQIPPVRTDSQLCPCVNRLSAQIQQPFAWTAFPFVGSPNWCSWGPRDVITDVFG